MGYTVQLTEPVTFEREDCCSCGITFFIPAELHVRRKKDTATFYCPNGHSLRYSQSETEVLRAKVKEWEAYAQSETKRKEWAEQEAKVQRERAEAAEAARKKTEASAKRMKRRVANGVCPCCTRSFTNLRRHMATKHPGHVDGQE
jgi:hypothetical protein